MTVRWGGGLHEVAAVLGLNVEGGEEALEVRGSDGGGGGGTSFHPPSAPHFKEGRDTSMLKPTPP